MMQMLCITFQYEQEQIQQIGFMPFFFAKQLLVLNADNIIVFIDLYFH